MAHRTRSVPSSAVVALVALVALVATVATGAAATSPSSPSTAAAASTSTHCGLDAKLVPECRGVLAGAYVAPAPGEDWAAAVARFERQTRHQTDVVRFYWTGDRLFLNAEEEAALRAGRSRSILYASWKPDIGYSWAQVAAGDADARLRRAADHLASTWTAPMFMTVHHEPEDEVRAQPGSGYTAGDYAAMFRHVVDVFRDRGVHNVTWVMNYMGFQGWGLKDWYDRLWPGDRYADWVGFDPYKTPRLGGQEGRFPALMNQYWGDTAWKGAYRWSVHHHPGVPIMLGEWGVAERDGDSWYKAHLFRRIAARIDRFPLLKAMIYFDNPDADLAGDVSVDTSARSLRGYRDFLSGSAVAATG